MKTYHLPATESDLRLLAELLREARQQPFQFAYPDREERIIELEKKWESLFPPAIAERAKEKVSEQWYLCDADLGGGHKHKSFFNKGGIYRCVKRGKDVLELVDEYNKPFTVLDWLPHFTLITNDLRFEIEKGIQPAEVEFNQSINN